MDIEITPERTKITTHTQEDDTIEARGYYRDEGDGFVTVDVSTPHNEELYIFLDIERATQLRDSLNAAIEKATTQ